MQTQTRMARTPCPDAGMPYPKDDTAWMAQGGPRKRWKDTIHKDLKHMGIPEDKWYSKASTLRSGWQAIYQTAVAEVSSQDPHGKEQNQFLCETVSKKVQKGK